jgi:magnesium transporter
VAVTVHYCDGGGVQTSPSLEVAAAQLAAERIVWIDAEGADDGVAAFLAEVLKLHPLAVEDILQDRPAPKVEDYGAYLYVVAHGILLGRDSPESLETVELDLVISQRWIFTHHAGPSRAVDAARESLARSARALERGPGFVAHAILDHMVDYYTPVVDAFDEEVDELEALVVQKPSSALLQRLLLLKRSLQRLRRVAVHQREVLHRLSRGEFDIIPEKALPFYRDVYDHFVRVADLADSYRELLSGALDAYLSVISNRMNEIMKALTLVATVMLPMTFVVGVYGMNFDYMPELKWRYGYLCCWLVLIAIPIFMIAWFRTRRWI